MSNESDQQVVGKNKFTQKAVLTLIGCWVVQLIVGAQLALGNTSVYFTSYYRNSLGYDVNQDTFYPMQPFIVILASVFFPVGNWLVDKFNNQARPVIFLAGALALSLVVLADVLQPPPKVFIFLYCLGMGIFKGFLGPAILRAGWSHLPERKGVVSGIIISGFGFGGFVFGIITSKFCNPDSLKFETDPLDGKKYLPVEVGNRVPSAIKSLCLIWLVMIMFGMVTITNYKQTSTDNDFNLVNEEEETGLLNEEE